jgi:pimeloyl-ACP methyl ester carboxylesterase/DNA-binding winged helix-turn-helix (wHTH) protein
VQIHFENHMLDPDRRELWNGTDLIALEPQVFDLLLFLIRSRDRVVSKDDLIASVWGGRIVSESTLSSRINAARKAVGDSGSEQRLIRTIARKGIRFVGEATESDRSSAPAGNGQAASPRTDQRQEIHFCTASDGVRIAYAAVGNGPPLVKTANWLNHLEYDWESPIWSPLLHTLAADYRLVRYDERGNGLSDWDAPDISFEAFVRDLEAVVDATGIERFSLLGISQGCSVAIAYALRHPERVSHLVLYGGYARGRRKRNSAATEQTDSMLALIRQGWGRENPAFRQLFTSLFVPGGTHEQMQWFNDLQRITTSPENAVRIMQATSDIDITDLLPQVRAKTLVLHCRNDAAQPFEEGRRMAAAIPGARFVALEGDNHMVLETDPAWERLQHEIKTFLKS